MQVRTAFSTIAFMNEKIQKTLEYGKILTRLSSFARTGGGKRLCTSLVPLSDEKDVKLLLSETDEAGIALEKAGYPPVFSITGIPLEDDIAEGSPEADIFTRLKTGASLGTKELLLIATLLENAGKLTEYKKTALPDESALSERCSLLDPLPSLSSEIRRCIISEDEIADSASPALRECRVKIRTLENRIKDSMAQMLTTYGDLLSDAIVTTRDGRSVIPVRSEYKSRIPGIVHGASQSGQTLFIEPSSIINQNNSLREAKEREYEEIMRILSALSASAAAELDAIKTDDEIMTALDLIFAKASLASSENAVRPSILGSGEAVSIKAARHPLLDPKKAVPIDIALGGSLNYNILIITGPNTGGKTVSLKTLGLLILMAQSGLFVPAESCSLPVFHEVYADIGDSQSIEESLSTFSGHMKNITDIIRTAKEDDLILFDELCAGTDPAEGAALAGSILEYMRVRKISAMVSTHYAELKSYALTTDGVQNACMEFNEDTLSPTFRLIIGLPGKSNAFSISRRLGLPKEITDDAKKRMGDEKISLENLLGSLERERRRAQSEADRLKKDNAILSERLKKLESREQKLSDQKDDILKKANEKAANILKDAKDQYDAAIRDLNKASVKGADISELEKKRRSLGEKTKGRLEKAAERPENTKSLVRPLKPEEIKEGDRVLVLSMGRAKGTVLSVPDRKGNTEVRMGIITTKINIKDLARDDSPEETVTFEGASFKKKGSGGSSLSRSMSISPEIQLLGMTADDAINALDKYIDDACLSSLESVRIVHGKGTGALRKAVEAFLKKDSRIASFRLGEFGEGDTGVTIATLK